MRIVVMSLLALGLCFNCTLGQDKKFSGPQPGEQMTPFKVLKIKDPDTIQVVKLVKPDETGATLVCFLHKITEPAIGLVTHLDFYASKQSGLKRYYVLLTDDRAKTEELLRRWSAHPLGRLGMSISLGGPEGPGAYGLNRNVNMTVLVAKDNKVVTSLALLDANYRDSEPILASVAKLLGKPEPSFAEISEGLQAERRQRREQAMLQNRIVKLAPNRAVGVIMYRMVHTEANRAENAKRRSEELLKWAGNNKERQAAMKKYCKAVLQGEFEMNDYSREAIKKLAKAD